MDRAIVMARDLAEASLARQILVDVLGAVKDEPAERRMAAADKLIGSRLLIEAAAFVERLAAAMKSEGTKAMQMMEEQHA